MMVTASVLCLLLTANQSQPETRSLLALTPVLNGTLIDEEWLALTAQGGAKGYLQWEPGTIFFAGSADKGEDIVVSIDRNGDGWLVGNDNIEFRVSYADGKGAVTAKTLDATRLDGPAWTSRTTQDLSVVYGVQGERWIIEANLGNGSWNTAKQGSAIGALIESMPGSASTGPAYLPRKLSHFRLGFDAAEGLPESAVFESSTRLRDIAREDSLSMQFEVKEVGAFSTAETRGEGFARSSISVVTRAFPSSDQKGKTRVNYQSAIERDASTGWRVLRSTLVDAKGNKTLLRTSFHVSELIVFDVSLPETLEYSEASQIVNGNLSVRSTGVGKVEGEFYSNVPTGWTIEKGASQKLLIYNPRGRERINLRFIVPAKASGQQSLTFTVIVGDRVYTKTVGIDVPKPS